MDSEATHICFISNIYGSYTDYLYFLNKCGKEQRIFKLLEEIKVEIKGLNILVDSREINQITIKLLSIINKMEEYLNNEYEFFIFTEKRHKLEQKIKDLNNKLKDQQFKESIIKIDNKLNEIVEIFEQ